MPTVNKLRGISEAHISASVNNYIPFECRPKSWKILSNSLADYIEILKK
ncbi:MAG: hypothetical protein OH338_00360 [Candidatus Parvarchaeota archaeon]|nr:hypothetical protein [Candidatus Parvarchaeota archaeon]MCW1294823.1 hypothetical protein [Candidatus Parvarchaeum tengchongense]MCW1295679.1 hypothetical protein [Candidatus Parvarchaeum tengchongense]MCW1299047.1 hypothetical protein [Candidatus Parvarchaeum tengchongense]MCW1311869.1 hypothetical protein [Candidatus Parvarchaeum tengchongense]